MLFFKSKRQKEYEKILKFQRDVICAAFEIDEKELNREVCYSTKTLKPITQNNEKHGIPHLLEACGVKIIRHKEKTK